MNGHHHSDRDRLLEQALKHELRAVNQPPAPEACLDAETLAAWMDGGLDPTSLAAAEAHASTCERCQALIGTLASSTEHLALGTNPLAPSTEARGTFALWRWWLAPLAAATAAVVIWVVVPPRADAPMLMAPVAESKARAPVVVPESASPPAAAAQPPAARDNAQPQFRAEPARQPAPQRQQQLADAAKPPSETDRFAPEVNREARVDAVTPPPPAPRMTAPAAPAAPPATVAEAAPAREERAAERPAAMAAGAPAPADVQKRMRQDASVLVIVVPSDPSRRWRLTADRAIERSADSGRTWVQVRPAQGELTAGSAPSATVAWFVGANGLVLRTTDGTTFTRLPAPVAADLAEVSAADARVATVITADGRRFVTDDGGATWRQN